MKGFNVRPVQVGPSAPRRETGQSIESVEDMIALCLAGETPQAVVESVLARGREDGKKEKEE